MAGTDMQLDRVANREKLKPRREPYWQRIAVGQSLGFRPFKIGDAGAWIARAYDPETQKRRYHALGEFTHLPPNERHKAALKDAREWFDHIDAGGSHKPVTVRQACERYAATRPDAGKRFKRYVYSDPIARIPLQKLTDKQVRGWRERLESLPALVTRRKKGKVATRKRSPVTTNRDMVPLRAALNLALEQGDALTARAWRSALKPHAGTGARRNLYLDRTQRRALIDALPEDLAAFVRGLSLLPLRPGALAALTVGDFDARRSALVISRDKAGEGRSILLPPSTVTLLKDQAKNKLPRSPLFAQSNGKPWDKDSWKTPIKEAARVAELPNETTAYTMRHATITDLVAGGLDLLTVAQVSGTSVRMIELHYGHLQRDRAAKALATLAL
jgi:integrase